MTNDPEYDPELDDDWPLGEYEPPPCPVCGRLSLPIVYGMPGPGLLDAADRGAVVLGGCVVEDGQPTHECPVGHPVWAQKPG